MTAPFELHGRRVLLRPLTAQDHPAWSEVRRRCEDWLVPWEPKPSPGAPDLVDDERAFAARCNGRERERQLGAGHGFGVFVEQRLRGEINISNVVRGAFQNASVGYWIDEAVAGQGYMPEALVVVMRFAFEELHLHRIQVSIIPRNQASRRVAEKVELREEGVALRYLQINGAWEDHVRYAMTTEEWDDRGDALLKDWVL